jgi:hypothetical protein
LNFSYLFASSGRPQANPSVMYNKSGFWINEPILDFSENRSKWLISNELRLENEGAKIAGCKTNPFLTRPAPGSN